MALILVTLGAIVGASLLAGGNRGKQTPDSEERHQAEPVTAEAWTATPTPGEEITPSAIDALTPTLGVTPVSAPLPQAAPSESQLVEDSPAEAGGVEATLTSYPWPYTTALRVAKCENAYHAYGYWRPAAIGRQGERGIMQIHHTHIDRIHGMGYTWDDMLKVEPNIAVAYDIWAEQGWAPWTCYWR